MELLEVRGLSKNFGGLAAVKGLSFNVAQTQLKALIGPNGAGKTTVLQLVCGFLKPLHGTVLFKGQDIAGLAPHKVARVGIGRTFQNINLFNNLTVTENILAGCHMHLGIGLHDCLLRTPFLVKAEGSARHNVEEILALTGLEAEANQMVSQLPLAKQRLVEIARALATKPSLLLLDEPGAGLTPHESTVLGTQVLNTCKSQGIAILLVEHNMRLVMGFAEDIVVMSFGEKIAEGTPEQIRKNTAVVEAYLGTGGGAHAQG